MSKIGTVRSDTRPTSGFVLSSGFLAAPLPDVERGVR
jgi:hypothetical protein